MARDEVKLNEADSNLGIISEDSGYISSTSGNERADCTDCSWDSDCPKDCSDSV